MLLNAEWKYLKLVGTRKNLKYKIIWLIVVTTYKEAVLINKSYGCTVFTNKPHHWF